MKKLFENKIFKTVFGIVRTIFYILLIIYLVFAIVERVSQNGIKGYRIYTIRTGSMDPAYKVYDVILVKETNPDDLRVGDVITYANTNYTVTHRIVFINDQNGEITTKGDANQINDNPITKDRILGKVEYKFKIYSFLTRLVNNKITFFFFVFVPLVVTIFLDIADNILERQKEKEEQSKIPKLKRKE